MGIESKVKRLVSKKGGGEGARPREGDEWPLRNMLVRQENLFPSACDASTSGLWKGQAVDLEVNNISSYFGRFSL